MQKANPKSTVAPKVHRLNFGMIRCLFRYSPDAGTSSWLWRFNPLLLRLLGEISPSLLCSYSSWGSALDLASPLHVGRLRADRTGLKEQLIRGLWLTQAGEREGYGVRGEPGTSRFWAQCFQAIQLLHRSTRILSVIVNRYHFFFFFALEKVNEKWGTH